MASLWDEVKRCRACGSSSFHEVINLGNQYVVDFPEAVNSDNLRAPLHVVRCTSCSLVQLQQTVLKERLFHHMWYRSSISESMRSSLEEIVRRINSCIHLKNGDRVLDIGCNDGYTLGVYPKHVTTVGVDPCLELVHEASQSHRADVAVHGFFSADRLIGHGPFKVITAIAMFYDVPNPQKFLEDCRALLTDDGLLVIQMNYLKTMLEDTTVDNISHEHLTYWSLNALNDIVEASGLQIQGAETNAVNGGSIRVYITKPGGALNGLPITKQMQLYGRLQALKLEEQKMGLDRDDVYDFFRTRVGQIRASLRNYVIHQNEQGAKFYLCGASTRGTALIQILDLPVGTFLGAAERDEKKYDHYMVGCWVKIMPEADVRADATHMLVLPYHFAEQIKLREQQWLAMGGTLVFPLPIPTLIHDGEERVMRLETGEWVPPATAEVQ